MVLRFHKQVYCAASNSPLCIGKLALFFSPLPHPKQTKFSDSRGDWGLYHHHPKYQAAAQGGTVFTIQPKILYHYAKYREFLVEHGARSVLSTFAKDKAESSNTVHPHDSSASAFLKGLGVLSAGAPRSRTDQSTRKFDDWYVSDSDDEETIKMNTMPFWSDRKVCSWKFSHVTRLSATPLLLFSAPTFWPAFRTRSRRCVVSTNKQPLSRLLLSCRFRLYYRQMEVE